MALDQGLVDGSPTQEIKPLLVDNQGRLIVASIAGAIVVGSITNPITIGVLPSIPAGNNRVGSVGIEGYFGGGWRKAPIPFGVSAQFKAYISGSGSNPARNSAAVPSNTIRVITEISGVCSAAGAMSNLYFYVNLNSTNTCVFHQITVTSTQTYFWDGWIVLFPGDYVRWVVTGTSITYVFSALGFDYPTNL